MNTKPLSLSIRMTIAVHNVNLKCDVFNDLIIVIIVINFLFITFSCEAYQSFKIFLYF